MKTSKEGMSEFERSVAGKVRTFLVHEVLEGDESELEEDTSLIASGIMNSRTMVKLMAFVDENYGVTLSFKQLNPGNLQTVRSIAKMIAASTSNKKQS